MFMQGSKIKLIAPVVLILLVFVIAIHLLSSHSTQPDPRYKIHKGNPRNALMNKFLNAADAGDQKTMNKLISKDAGLVNCFNAKGYPALWCSMTSEHWDAAELLIRRGADVNTKWKSDTPLSWALFDQNPEFARFLISHGADVNAVNDRGETPLHQVMADDNLWELVSLLISKGANVNAVDKAGRTPLHCLSGADRTEMVCIAQVLVKKGANVCVLDKSGQAALISKPELARQIIPKGYNPNLSDDHGMTMLHYAVQYMPTVVSYLLEHGAEIDHRDKTGETPLFYANAETAAILIKNGADVNSRNNSGRTPLEEAVLHLNETKTKLLWPVTVDNPAKAKIMGGKLLIEALSVALSLNEDTIADMRQFESGYEYKSNGIISFLIDHGASINQQDAKGNTALYLALQGSHCYAGERTSDLESDYSSSFESLLKAGADVNIPNKNGNTPLHLAAKYDMTHCIKMLIKRGARTDTRNAQKLTPFGIAERNHSRDTIRLLRRMGVTK